MSGIVIGQKLYGGAVTVEQKSREVERNGRKRFVTDLVVNSEDGEEVLREEGLESVVVQLIPLQQPLTTWWPSGSDNTLSSGPECGVLALAVCGDGAIRAVAAPTGTIEVITQDDVDMSPSLEQAPDGFEIVAPGIARKVLPSTWPRPVKLKQANDRWLLDGGFTSLARELIEEGQRFIVLDKRGNKAVVGDRILVIAVCGRAAFKVTHVAEDSDGAAVPRGSVALSLEPLPLDALDLVVEVRDAMDPAA